jgi:hypothetical protein
MATFVITNLRFSSSQGSASVVVLQRGWGDVFCEASQQVRPIRLTEEKAPPYTIDTVETLST